MSKSKLVYMAGMPTVGFALLFVVCFLKQFVLNEDQIDNVVWYKRRVF